MSWIHGTPRLLACADAMKSLTVSRTGNGKDRLGLERVRPDRYGDLPALGALRHLDVDRTEPVAHRTHDRDLRGLLRSEADANRVDVVAVDRSLIARHPELQHDATSDRRA